MNPKMERFSKPTKDGTLEKIEGGGQALGETVSNFP